MNPVLVSYRYIGTWYRFDMGDFGDIGIGLNILLTDTDISVSVYRYRSNSTRGVWCMVWFGLGACTIGVIACQWNILSCPRIPDY